MATYRYRVEPPSEFSSPLKDYDAKHPHSLGRVPSGKADSCKKLVTWLDKEDLSVDMRSALSIESICLQLVLKAIELNPNNIEEQAAHVCGTVQNIPEYEELNTFMGTLQPDQTEETTQPDQTEKTTQPDQTAQVCDNEKNVPEYLGHQAYEEYQADETTQPDQTAQVCDNEKNVPEYLGHQAYEEYQADETTQPDQTEKTQPDQLSCTRPCAVHGFDLDLTALPDPAAYYCRQNIHAAGQLCQIRIVGAAIINAVNTLRDTRWNKFFNPQERDLCNKLYCWGEERNRVPDPNVLYASTFARPNTAFIPRWNGLVAAISAYMDSANCMHKPDPTPVHTAAFALQAYLDSAMTGIIRMQINDCAAHLAKAIEILDHYEVRERFGTGGAQNMWSVVAAILNSDSLTAELKPNFDSAQAIRTVFVWLELFPELTKEYELDNPNNVLFPAIAVIRHLHGTARPANQEVPEPALSRLWGDSPGEHGGVVLRRVG